MQGEQLNVANESNFAVAAETRSVDDEAAIARGPRVLFCSWTELDITSGTPMIICDAMRHFPPGNAEAIVEANLDHRQHRRVVDIEHPIRKYRLHGWLWPFKRGHRVRNRLARLGLPALVAQLVWRIRRFRPDCLLAIYAQSHWIHATWIASRLTGVPLIYHIHDAFLEVNERRQRSRYCRWLERKTLTTSRVLALDDHMAEHYERRYGINCTVLRHIVRHMPLQAQPRPLIYGNGGSDPSTAAAPTGRLQALPSVEIGFAGAIYDSNSRQLAELCRLIREDPGLQLRIWTGSTPEMLDRLGICGPRVTVGFESNYERLLANLASCDLLYLPLHSSDGATTSAGAMEFSLPTKSFDYALSGTPILVHCPESFALSRFFRRHPCGYVLNEPRTEAVKAWLDRWRSGLIPQLDDDVRRETLAMFSPHENKRILWRVIGEEVDRAARVRRQQ